MSGDWQRVCAVGDVGAHPVGRVIGDSGEDRDRVCVVRRDDGSFVAMLDRCPHRDIALSGGVVKDGALVCPGHFWRFDLATGERSDLPAYKTSTYQTRVVDGWVEALVPAGAPRLSMREWLLAQARERRPAMAVDTQPEDPPDIGESVDVHVAGSRVRTNYHDLGSGPPVVLVHGSGPGVSAWANWRLTMPALSEQFRVLAPDVLGFGYTERPPGVRYGLDSWTDHLVGFLDALGLDRVALVGNSFGGALAMSVATRHPDRVGRLVLMGSVGAAFPITPGLDAVWGFEPSLEAMRSLLDVFAHDKSLVGDDLARLRLDAATRPGVQEAFAAMFPPPRQAHVDALTIDEELVRGIAVPTLLVHGRDDQVIPLSTSLRLHELIDDSRLHVFGRCGHWVQIEKTAEFNQLVGEFLRA